MLAISLFALLIGVLLRMMLGPLFGLRTGQPKAKMVPPILRARSARRSRTVRQALPALTTLNQQPVRPRRRALVLLAGLAVVAAAVLIYGVVQTNTPTAPAAVELAVQLPLSGAAAQSGLPPYQGIQLAIEEANASGSGPYFSLRTYDDQGSDEIARGLVEQIVASQATLVLGPAFSTTALATGPLYAAADLSALTTNATADQITANRTTFRMLFQNSDQGELLAHYLVRVLGQKRAAVFVVDTAYGATMRAGFERAAAGLGLQADYYVFSDEVQANELAEQAAQTQPPAVVLLTLDRAGARLLVALRKLGVSGPFLGGDALGKQGFRELLRNEPEERAEPGFFTNRLYGLTPVIFDAVDPAMAAFAERYRARFGNEPDWTAVSGYDAAHLAIAAVRATTPAPGVSRDLAARREAVGAYLRGLDSPAKALPGLLGPFWLDESRARRLAIRVGRFQGEVFESAAVQIVAVTSPDPTEVASGAVFELGPGRYARLQQVAHTGLVINKLERPDPARSSFSADFSIWLRFARNAGPQAVDPTALHFPDLVGGGFDPDRPLQQRVLEDGSEYRLWQVQGEFRNSFDLRRFPFDRQRLVLAFSNLGATTEQLIYVPDQQANVVDVGPGAPSGLAAPGAFDSLEEWQLLDTRMGRTDRASVTASQRAAMLPIPAHFAVTIELERRLAAGFASTVLPLLLMTLVLFGALFLPTHRTREQVAVMVVAGLGGLVPLTALNSQLGGLGYALLIANLYYVFFGLALLCLVTAFSVERLRAANHPLTAARVVVGTRILFVIAVVATVAVATLILRG